MQKGSALIVVILIALIFFAIGFYFYSSNVNYQDPVSPSAGKEETKTYTSQELGFEFGYGRNLSVKEDSEEEFNKRGNGNFRKNFTGYIGYSPREVLGAVAVLDKTSSFDASPLTVWIFSNADNLTVKQWYEDYWYYPFVWGDFTASREKVSPQNIATISGQLAYFGIVNYQPNAQKFIYLTKNGKMYLFRIIGQEGDQILSTFKFIQ